MTYFRQQCHAHPNKATPPKMPFKPPLCVSPGLSWPLFPSPPTVPAVFSPIHSGVLIYPIFGQVPNPCLPPGLSSSQPGFVSQKLMHLHFPSGALSGVLQPLLSVSQSAASVVTPKDSHLHPSAEMALGPSSCPTGRQMPGNDPFHESLGAHVSVPCRLLV